MWHHITLWIVPYHTQQTLPEMQIYCMEQDHSGFVVFGIWNQPIRQICIIHSCQTKLLGLTDFLFSLHIFVKIIHSYQTCSQTVTTAQNRKA